MAKLSDDASGWSASGKRKKIETQKADPQVPKPGSSKKKNTKKWCKGIEGRYHEVKNVQLVNFNDNCWNNLYSPGYYWRDKDKWCGHHRHFEMKCVGCGMEANRLSKAAKRYNGIKTEQEKLEEKWCDKGHLWDWEEFNFEDWKRKQPAYTRLRDVVIRQGAFMYQYKHWKTGAMVWRTVSIKVEQYCVMCGKRSGRRKTVYPE